LGFQKGDLAHWLDHRRFLLSFFFVSSSLIRISIFSGNHPPKSEDKPLSRLESGVEGPLALFSMSNLNDASSIEHVIHGTNDYSEYFIFSSSTSDLP